jgi:hypothetical protein
MKTIIFLYFFYGFSAYSGVCSFGTKVFYGNGMFNSKYDMYESKDALANLNIINSQTNSGTVEYDVAENLNESRILNVLSVILQKLNNNYKTAWRMMFGLELPAPFTHLDLLSFFLDPIKDNFKKMLNKYQLALDEGKKALIISHSQGNLFAEEAIQRLSGTRNPSEIGIGNIRIATPAFSSFSFPHTTFEDDFVINSVRTIAGAPKPNLPKIGSGPAPERDPLGHNFIKAYLGTELSKDKIKKDIVTVANNTNFPGHGSAFSIEVVTRDEDGLEFVIDTSKEKEWDYFQHDNQNQDRQDYSLSCKKIEPTHYSLALKTSFIQKHRCPCPFKITIKSNNRINTYSAIYRFEKQSDEKLYHFIDGLMPELIVTQGDHDFNVDIVEKTYPPIEVN